MSTERKTRAPDGQSRNRPLRLSSLTRYDLVLTAIPVVFLLTAAVSGLLGVTLQTALAIGSLLGAAVIVDALFLNPPTTGGPRN